jgi:hypothetical protein
MSVFSCTPQMFDKCPPTAQIDLHNNLDSLPTIIDSALRWSRGGRGGRPNLGLRRGRGERECQPIHVQARYQEPRTAEGDEDVSE